MATSTDETRTIDPRFSGLTDDQRKLLAQYTGDMAALESDIEAMMDRQLSLAKNDSLAGPAIREFHDAIRDQRNLMISLRDALGEEQTANTLKEKGASVMGAVSGLISKVRSEGISKALRDDYASFNLAAVSYTMLLTTARAVGSPDVASAAEKGLGVYAKAVQKINQLIPAVVVAELSGQDGVKSTSRIVDEVVKTADNIWKRTDQSGTRS
jgi:ferritin-like metal-binding protein YciE